MSTTKNNIPKWFDIEKYQKLTELTASEFIKQLSPRASALHFIQAKTNKTYLFGELFDDDEEIKRDAEDVFFSGWLDGVLSGDVYLNVIDERVYDKIHQQSDLDGYGSIRPVTMRDLDRIEKNLSDPNFKLVEPNNQTESYQIMYELRNQSVSKAMNHGLIREVMVNIALSDYTDREILNDLEVLLPVLREQLCIKEPQKEARMGLGTFKKMINYQIFAFLDLEIWALHTEATISDGLLSRVLYPDSSSKFYESKQIYDTIRPFALESCSNPAFIDDMLFFLERDGYENIRANDLIKM